MVLGLGFKVNYLNNFERNLCLHTVSGNFKKRINCINFEKRLFGKPLYKMMSLFCLININQSEKVKSKTIPRPHKYVSPSWNVPQLQTARKQQNAVGPT